jgi:subtilisin family serine protease
MRPGTRLCRRAWQLAVAVLLVAFALAAGVAAASAPGAGAVAVGGDGAYAPGEAIVQFEPGTEPIERREAREEAGVGFDRSLSLARSQIVAVEGTVQAAIRRLERQPGVAYAQPNYRYEALAVEPPDDTFFDQLWGLSDPVNPDPGVNALGAWEHSRGGGQTIAVVDTGVDLTHPDLAPNLWTNTLEGLGPKGVDEDLNGRIDDVHGYDFVDDDGDPDDYGFHGTHVAGTAAAVAGNGEGIAGVAPEAEIMAVRVLDGDGSGFTAEIAEGIAYAAENGADVINLSLGGVAGADDQLTEDAIEIAAAENAVVVAAAGNEGVDNDAEPHTPCALPQANLICVAALNQAGSLAGFSNFGAETVDIAAPGTGVLSAKVDYGAPLFDNGFEPGTTALWATSASNGGIAWDFDSQAATGAQAATDSPGGDYGQAADPSEFAASELFTDDAVDLSGERGCRVHFRTMYEIEEFFDGFYAGAVSEASDFDGNVFDGTSANYPTGFSREEASISELDDRDDVHPIFAVLSDESVELDGAYVDDVRLICRDETYEDEIASGPAYDLPDAGNYVRFSGTSMATPHVAGVVAVVRSAVPGLSVQQVVEAVLAGTSPMPMPDPARRTVTGGIADACQAIAVATGADVAADCPGSGEWEPIDEGGTTPPAIPVAPVTYNPIPYAEPSLPPAPDRRPPSTFFRKRPSRVVHTRAAAGRVVFKFGADESGVTFVCRVDQGLFRPCGARFVRRFSAGSHVLRVVARDATGNADRTPAVARFKVKRRG